MNSISVTGETLTRYVREESRAAFLVQWNEALTSRRMALDPAAAIRALVEPLLRRECRREFDALLRKIRATNDAKKAAQT